MRHTHTLWVSSLGLALPIALLPGLSALSACGGDGGHAATDALDDAAPGTDTTSPGDTGGPVADTTVAADAAGPPPAWTDDDALVAWLLAVVAGCPPTSQSTAPGGWATSLLTDGGCIVRHPADWRTNPAPGVFTTTRDASEQVGWLVVSTWLEGTAWTVDTLSSHLIDLLRASYPDITVIGAWTEPLVDPWGVTTWMKTQVVKLTHTGTPTLGVFKVVHSACSVLLNACPLTASGSWAPLTELPQWACTLAQIEATLRCPSGGDPGCDDDACAADCKAAGHDGGGCVGDNCACY